MNSFTLSVASRCRAHGERGVPRHLAGSNVASYFGAETTLSP